LLTGQSDSPGEGTLVEPSQKSEVPNDQELAGEIQRRGWWQGSIVSAGLFDTEAEFPLVSHWVIASQTCNLFNDDFEKIPKVEWVGGRLIPESSVQAAVQNGANARRLHTQTATTAGPYSYIELNINDRIWNDRRPLANHYPEPFQIIDSGSEPQLRQREIFANWIGRSYTRAEFPDEFNEALKNSKLRDNFRKLLQNHADQIYGLFLELAPVGYDLDKGPLSTEELARLKPPFQIVSMTVVVNSDEFVGPIQREVAGLSATTIPDPTPPPPNTARGKISRLDVAASHGIHLNPTDIAVLPIESWSVRDLLQTVRYTDHDHLSGVDDLAD
jgi:hypothetical protein